MGTKLRCLAFISLSVWLFGCGPKLEDCTQGSGDEDGNGLADCADPACANVVFCIVPSEDCGNLVDDDGDGAVDCADADCANDPQCVVCGDDIISTGEQCDNNNLNGKSCTDFGFSSGTLACDGSCFFDTTACVVAPPGNCGDGIINVNSATGILDQCDDALNNGTPGDPCAADCTLVPPPGCGDGAIQAGETCDGANLNGQSCTTIAGGFTGGTLACNANCLSFNTSQCTGVVTTFCGDNVQQVGEQCDGVDLAGQSCVSLGLGGGTLACTPSNLANGCTFDTSGCGAAPNTECDAATNVAAPSTTNGNNTGHTDSNTGSCDTGNGSPDVVFSATIAQTGALTATLNHGGAGGNPDVILYARTACADANSELACSDSQNAADPEVLNLNVTAGQTIFFFADGFNGSTGTFSLVLSAVAAAVCGNNTIDAGETCDGNSLNNQTCQSQGFAGGGNLACNANCGGFNTAGCVAGGAEICTNGVDDDADTKIDCGLGVAGNADTDCTAQCANACAVPTVIADHTTINGDTRGHADSRTTGCIGTNGNGVPNGAPDVAFLITVGTTGVLDITLNSQVDLGMSVRNVCNQGNTEFACADNNGPGQPENLTIPNVTAGEQLSIIVDGFVDQQNNKNAGAFTLIVNSH